MMDVGDSPSQRVGSCLVLLYVVLCKWSLLFYRSDLYAVSWTKFLQLLLLLVVHIVLLQAVVLEGKYWKRRLLCVTTEYMKWRQYYKEKCPSVDSSNHPDEVSHLQNCTADVQLFSRLISKVLWCICVPCPRSYCNNLELMNKWKRFL